MLNNVRSIASCFVALSFVVAACGDGDSSDDGNGTGGGAGKGGSAGSSGSTGKGGSSGSSGSTGKGGSAGSSGSAGNGGSSGSSGAGTGGSSAGTSGSAGAGSGGEGGDDTGSGGDAGTGNGTGGAGDGGMPGTGGTGGDDGTGGAPEGGMGGEPSIGAGGNGTAGEAGAPVTGSGGAGGEGGAPVAEWDTIQNPGFELWAAGEPSAGWTVVDEPDSAATSWQAGGARTGTGFLNLWLGSAYIADVSQVVSPIPDGTYTLSIWHWGSAYTEQYVYVSGYDEANAETRLTANTAANSAFAEIRIENIPVTSGQVKIGIYSVGATGNWSHFDDVSLTLSQ